VRVDSGSEREKGKYKRRYYTVGGMEGGVPGGGCACVRVFDGSGAEECCSPPTGDESDDLARRLLFE
jgi:hypothetical protein